MGGKTPTKMNNGKVHPAGCLLEKKSVPYMKKKGGKTTNVGKEDELWNKKKKKEQGRKTDFCGEKGHTVHLRLNESPTKYVGGNALIGGKKKGRSMA